MYRKQFGHVLTKKRPEKMAVGTIPKLTPKGSEMKTIKHERIRKATIPFDSVMIYEGDGFALFYISESRPWFKLKMIRTKRAPRGKNKSKANWWIGWNSEEKRFRRDSDAGHLAQHKPEIYKELETFLSSHFSA